MPVRGLDEALALVGLPRSLRARRLAGGHIHGTWSVHTTDGRVVAQVLNAHVFPDLQACEQNLRRISEHMAGHPEVRVPQFLAGPDGRCQVTDSDGRTWRISQYATGTRAAAAVRSASAAYRGAKAFGQYAAALATLPGLPLQPTIARFHDLVWRIEQLDQAIGTDRVGRVGAARRDVDRIRTMAIEVGVVVKRLPVQPVRPVHNDAKVGNLRVGIDQAPMVLDLDTTMPGLVLFDVGELLRTATHTRLEDDADSTCTEIDHERVSAVLEGFAAGMGNTLTDAERSAFGPAAPLMAMENAVRMLTDHLDGDRYFGAAGPGHNLTRARAQSAVALGLMAVF